MNRQRARRLSYIVLLVVGVASAAGLILYSLKQNINLFFTPTQALTTALPQGHHFRLGGQVKPGSVVRDKSSLAVHFILTDMAHELAVMYTGILPDLFREGNGAIAEGYWSTDKHYFIATQILAKHDEKYQPRALQ